MNFRSEREIAGEHVELKYCERCGGLFLRAPAASIVHCAGCAFRLQAEPDVTPVNAPGRWRSRRNARLSSGPKPGQRQLQRTIISNLQGVARETLPC
jgi:hypothetical protein